MKFRYRKKSFTIYGFSKKDAIYSAIAKSRTFYEVELLEYMRKVINPVSNDFTVSIDIGANIGNHSIFLQSFISRETISVEPNPTVADILRKNLSRNNLKCTVCQLALGEKKGFGRIELPSGSENNIGMAKFQEENGIGNIRLTTLDSLIEKQFSSENSYKKIHLIKIDAEGMELSILKGSTKVLRQYKPHLFVEAQSKSDYLKLKGFLSRFGYRPLRNFGSTPVYHFSFNPSSWKLITSIFFQTTKLDIYGKRILRKLSNILELNNRNDLP